MLTTKEVAKEFNINVNTVLKKIKEGKIKALKLGRVYRVTEMEFERLKREGF